MFVAFVSSLQNYSLFRDICKFLLDVYKRGLGVIPYVPTLFVPSEVLCNTDDQNNKGDVEKEKNTLWRTSHPFTQNTVHECDGDDAIWFVCDHISSVMKRLFPFKDCVCT